MGNVVMESMTNFRFSIRQFLAAGNFRTKFLILLNYNDEKYNRLLTTSDTDICIEGYPRCANSFAYNKFNAWNPGLKISRHLHIPYNILEAVRLGKPTVVLIRSPLEAISSFSMGLPNVEIKNLVKMYINFYRQVEHVKEYVVIADFESVTKSFSDVILNVNKKFQCNFNIEESTVEDDMKILNSLREHSKNIGWSSMASAPDKARKISQEKKLNSILEDSNYGKCCEIYNLLMMESLGSVNENNNI